MNTLKKLEKRLVNKPGSPENEFYKHLVEVLSLKEKLDIAALYELPYADFKLAMAIMNDWRLDQYTKTKGRLRELVLLERQESL